MTSLEAEAAAEACVRDDLEALQHLVPTPLGPNSRIQNFRIGDRPYSTVPFLCICCAHGSNECFEYLIQKGATAYYADLVCFVFILTTHHFITRAATAVSRLCGVSWTWGKTQGPSTASETRRYTLLLSWALSKSWRCSWRTAPT